MAFVNLLEAVYPIGSVYLSTVSISPASTVGGTWQQITGRYLRSGTSATATGGSDSISFTYGLDWLSYYYTPAAYNQSYGEQFFGLYNETTGTFQSGNVIYENEMSGIYNTGLNTGSAVRNSCTHQGATMTITKDLLPSYYTVYCWVRTA